MLGNKAKTNEHDNDMNVKFNVRDIKKQKIVLMPMLLKCACKRNSSKQNFNANVRHGTVLVLMMLKNG
ncbi:hypothetical protein AMJ85_09170 [candidate division BRC1 bacterium SM23_51]|nr:MAG: hypothetical protein AMJ85_09170 [candidate division BRC1 bacterium SM23_51]